MASVIPLSRIPSGRKARIVKIDAGRLMVARLYQMGLYPGSTVEVLNNQGIGPITVRTLGVMLALGRGMADKILVELLP